MIWIFQNLFWNHMEGFKYTQHNQTNNLNMGKVHLSKLNVKEGYKHNTSLFRL